MKERNLLPKHLKASYLPKIQVKEHFDSPISKGNKIKAVIVIMALALFISKRISTKNNSIRCFNYYSIITSRIIQIPSKN